MTEALRECAIAPQADPPTIRNLTLCNDVRAMPRVDTAGAGKVDAVSSGLGSHTH